MYRILGKANLHAVESIAQKSTILLQELSALEDTDTVRISVSDLMSLTSGYLFLYNSVMEESLMPNPASPKHKIFNLH